MNNLSSHGSASAERPVRAYECFPVERNRRGEWQRMHSTEGDYGQTIFARSAGQARYRYWIDLHDAWPDFPILRVRSRVVSEAPTTTERFSRMRQYRGIPFATLGMRVIAEGCDGVIVGSNDSANLDVLVGDAVLNCHPCFDVQYFDADGRRIAFRFWAHAENGPCNCKYCKAEVNHG